MEYRAVLPYLHAFDTVRFKTLDRRQCVPSVISHLLYFYSIFFSKLFRYKMSDLQVIYNFITTGETISISDQPFIINTLLVTFDLDPILRCESKSLYINFILKLCPHYGSRVII